MSYEQETVTMTMFHTWLAIVPALDPQTEAECAPMPGTQVMISAETPEALTEKLNGAVAMIGGTAADLDYTGNYEEGNIVDAQGNWTRLDWQMHPCDANGTNHDQGDVRESFGCE